MFYPYQLPTTVSTLIIIFLLFRVKITGAMITFASFLISSGFTWHVILPTAYGGLVFLFFLKKTEKKFKALPFSELDFFFFLYITLFSLNFLLTEQVIFRIF